MIVHSRQEGCVNARGTSLTIGIHSLDSRAFQKKGVWVFFWRDTIQKKPQGMEISLRQKGAFLPNTGGRKVRERAVVCCQRILKNGQNQQLRLFRVKKLSNYEQSFSERPKNLGAILCNQFAVSEARRAASAG